ncbi:enoyl-CoA hydratase/isomerase family protein [Streptomyces sp. NPDC047000]|uniref:enoyl-CoA hydratase/isomerase family protein n=1 Tax=Streptomyces sp. NPDC047000 TaxID=3155474 RepID=UPI003401BCE4
MDSPCHVIAITSHASPPTVHDRVVGVATRPHKGPDGFDVLLSQGSDAPRPRAACPDPHTTARHIEALEVAVTDGSITHFDPRGTGPAFCSGGDLGEFGVARDAAEAHRIRVSRSPAALLPRCDFKVTAHLHGACVGAGIELAAFARQVRATPDTVIRLPEISMGLIPGTGGTTSLPARIGRERTAYLALSGAALTAPEALGWGLVDELASGN